MKAMKKMLALLLALTMVFALATTAFAAAPPTEETPDAEVPEGKGKIYIDPAYPGETYAIYRVFDLSYQKDADLGEAFTYTLRTDGDWAKFKNYSGAILNADGTTKTVNSSDYFVFEVVDADTTIITWNGANNADRAAEAAKLIKVFVDDETISVSPEFEATVPGDLELDSDGNAIGQKVYMGDFPYGYYFVTTTTGAICSLDTNHDKQVIADKPQPHRDDKQQSETDGNYTDADTNVSVGDKVYYEVDVTIQPGGKNLVMHDKMTNSLDYCGDANVIVYGADGNPLVNTGNSKYEVKSSELEDDCTFEVVFKDDYLKTIGRETVVNVRYYGTLNMNAVMYDDETTEAPIKKNSNETHLTWGNSHKSKGDEVVTHTFEFTIVKFTGETTNTLEGAKFELYKDEACTGAKVQFHAAATNVDDTDKATAKKDVYTVCTKTDCPDVAKHVTEIETDASGTFNIEGLGDTTYYLKETKAPVGYNLWKDPVKVTIVANKDANGEVTSTTVTFYTKGSDGSWVADTTHTNAALENTYFFENTSGLELPNTGGIGTTIFYVVGSVLMLGAAVMLITKKRVNM